MSCICIFSALYLPSVGGVQTYTANIATELARAGERVIVVTNATETPSGRSVDDEVEIVRLPCRALLNGRYPVPRRNEEYRKLMDWLETQAIDHVVVNTRFYPHSIEGLAFARRKGITPIVIEHGSAHLTMGNAAVDKAVELVEHAMTKRGLAYGAHYYAVSKRASSWLEHFGITSSGEIHNAINADEYRDQVSARSFREELNLPEGSLLAVFIGRLVPEKGVLQLAEASKLLDAGSIAIAVAGDGPLRDKLAEYESTTFKLVGPLSKPDAAAFLVEADVMCLPSRSEGFATTLLEAAACSTPSIVTHVGGTDELIPDASCGTIIDDAQPETIARALRAALKERRKLAEQGSNAATLARISFSWKRTAEHLLAACQEANRER